jgi:hypothetical protein
MATRNPHILNHFWRSRALTIVEIGTYTETVTRPHRRWAIVLALAALLPGARTADAQDRQRALFVTVVDANGQPVTELGPSDFIVREDNVEREVLSVAPADTPMQIAILVDNSQAAAADIQNIRTALGGFVAALTVPTVSGRHNEVAIITLGDRPTLVADYSIERAELEKGVGRIFAQPGSGNYLLDGLIEASRGLEKRGAERPIIVAITTEGPEFSSRSYQTVLEPLRETRVAFYAVVFGPPSHDMSASARDRGMVLDAGPRDTGGRRENLLSSMTLAPTLDRLAAQLTHALRVTYAQPESLIPPETVTVSVKRPGLSARGTRVNPAARKEP